MYAFAISNYTWQPRILTYGHEESPKFSPRRVVHPAWCQTSSTAEKLAALRDDHQSEADPTSETPMFIKHAAVYEPGGISQVYVLEGTYPFNGFKKRSAGHLQARNDKPAWVK